MVSVGAKKKHPLLSAVKDKFTCHLLKARAEQFAYLSLSLAFAFFGILTMDAAFTKQA